MHNASLGSYIALLLLLFTGINSDDEYYSKYNGYKVLEARTVNSDQLAYLRELQRYDPGIDFWTDINSVNEPVTFMVSPDYYSKIQKNLQKRGISYQIINDDVQQLLLTTSSKKKRKLEGGGLDLHDYNQLEDIYQWMNETANQCPDNFRCKVYSIGETHEGRIIPVFRIWRNKPNRKSVWIDATIHAREWLATATAIQILNHVVKGNQPSAKIMRGRYDWYIAPVLNPDGYVYSHTTDRLWRKNRSKDSRSDCIGTDLNRNFDYHWGIDGISRDPCSQVYCGLYPASEPETMAVQNELIRLAPSLVSLITLHTYGNMWMFPYGFVKEDGLTCTRAKLHEQMMEVADISADAIQSVYNTRWSRGSSCEVVYTTSGTSTDFALGVANISYPFCLELRGTSFVVPPDEIDKSFAEVWRGILEMLAAISKRQLV